MLTRRTAARRLCIYLYIQASTDAQRARRLINLRRERAVRERARTKMKEGRAGSGLIASNKVQCGRLPLQPRIRAAQHKREKEREGGGESEAPGNFDLSILRALAS